LGEQRYLKAAEKAIAFLFSNIYIDNSLLRTCHNGKSYLFGYLSDYAFLTATLIDLYESTCDWISVIYQSYLLNKIVV